MPRFAGSLRWRAVEAQKCQPSGKTLQATEASLVGGLRSAFGPGGGDMFQEEDSGSSSTEDPVFLSRHRCGLFQEVMVGAGSMPGMDSEAQGRALRWKSVHRGKSHPDVSLQAGAAAVASQRRVELQAVGQGPSQRLPPGPPQGSTGCSKRLQVSLCDILTSRCLRNLCNTLPGLPKRAQAGVEWPAEVELTSCSSPREMGDQGISAPGGKRGSSTLNEEGFPGWALPTSRGPAPTRTRRKSRKSESCCRGEQGTGDVSWLEQSPGVDSPLEGTNLASLGGPCSRLCQEDTRPGDPEPLGRLTSSLEATASKACTGPFVWQKRDKCAKKLRRKPASCAQEQPTGGSSDGPCLGEPVEASPEACPRWEEVKMPCGVKRVCYLGSEAAIQLLGAISHGQAGGQQPPQLEALDNLMENSSAAPSQKPRTRKRPMAQGPATGQGGPEEAVKGKPFLEVAKNSAQLQSGEEIIALNLDIRVTVFRSLWEALWSRVQELPDLGLNEEAVEGIAAGIETALFDLTQGTSCRYKTKYRSLLFNLRDPRNPDLFLKVVHGDIIPHDLVRMSSVQLAPQELARWRDQEEKRGLEIIVQQQKEPRGLPTSKLTHKGEVEILRDADQMLTLEELVQPEVSGDCSPQVLPVLLGDITKQHHHHFLDPDCHICTESLSELPGFSRACRNRGENAFQRAPSPAPVSSPEMPRARETPPTDRYQTSAGSTKALPSPAPWEGALDMFSIKRFRARAQLVSGHSCRLIQALPEVIHSAGRIPPSTVWDLLTSIAPAEAKDVSVVRLCPQGDRDTQNCRLLFSYLNNKQCHGLASVQHMGVVLLPLPAFQPLPTRLRSLGGPGLETTHSSLLLAVLLPKEGLPKTAVSSTVRRKVHKIVSFNKKVEMRCYQPEDKKPDWAPKDYLPQGDSLQQSQDKGTLSPGEVCAWQKFPRGRGKPWVEAETWQCHGKQPPELGWYWPQHSYLAVPAASDFGYGHQVHRASCHHGFLLQHLRTLVTMNQQLQASLRPSGQDLLPTPTAFPQPPAAPGTHDQVCQSPAAPEIPGPAPHPSLGPAAGTKYPFPRKA
ncbi:SPOC domain-containing protein 1 isoform X1 [Fukomys damarensis]|uniref:SPOC domain-containing protein 1 isoform X1 n=3 Tax=Fukomys damarensis TaxID=885580 RepID=UPI00053F8CE5|nr:SPOC domain-containing protein 1 isoform X1 [Fukomys damarensis]